MDTKTDLINELENTQYRSNKPGDFENALKRAFSYFGFEAELIGKAGDTDVLLTANIGNESYKVTVDGLFMCCFLECGFWRGTS